MHAGRDSTLAQECENRPVEAADETCERNPASAGARYRPTTTMEKLSGMGGFLTCFPSFSAGGPVSTAGR